MLRLASVLASVNDPHTRSHRHAMTRLPTTASSRRPSGRLLLLIALVLLAHWAVLRAAPLSLAAHASADAGSGWSFATRTIAPAPVPTPAALAKSIQQPAPAIARKPPRAPDAGATERQPPTQSGLEQNMPIAPEEYNDIATNFIANSTFNNSAVELQPELEPVQLAAASIPATPAPNAASSPKTRTPDAPPPAAKAVRKYVFPPSSHLKYDVKGEIKGFPYHVNGDLQWTQDGKTYNARMEISHFLLGSRVQTSTGRLGPHGLEPIRFGDKVRSEVAAHFDYEKNKVTFSANTPEAPLLPGAQDQLSVTLQIASMLAADPKLFTPASTLSFQAVGPKSSESWVFTVGVSEKLGLPGGEMSALRVWREPNGEYDSRVEMWFAPDMGYLPVRIRLSQANGDVADQLWRSTQK